MANPLRHIAILAALMAPLHAEAVWQMPVTNYQRQDYDAGTQNWCIAQQDNDWLYVGNNYGLLEFDGSAWDLYGIWNSSTIRSIRTGQGGRIFVGGSNEYGYFQDDGLGRLEFHPLSTHLPEAYANFGEIWSICIVRSRVYFQGHDRVFVHDMADGSVSVVECGMRIDACEQVGDIVYAIGEKGVFTIDGVRLTGPLPGSKVLGGLEVKAARRFDGDKLLIGTSFGGLFLLADGHVSPFMTDADSFVRDNMFFSLAVNAKYVAVGTVTGGVCIMDREGHGVRYVNVNNGLQDNTVLSLFFDRCGNLWCGLDNGIDRISVDSPLAQLYGRTSALGSGYAMLTERTTAFLGTSHGLYTAAYPFLGSEDQIDAHLVAGSLGQVWSLGRIGGHVVCCHDKGLFYVENGQLRTLSSDEGFWQFRTFALNHDVGIVGSYSGLYVIESRNGRPALRNKIRGIDSPCKTFEIDNNNRIWLATERGVECLTLNSDMTQCTSTLMTPAAGNNVYNNVMLFDGRIVVSHGDSSFVVGPNGRLSADAGVLSLCDGAGHFYTAIQRDQDDNVWYITGNALKVRRKNPHTGIYDSPALLIWDIPSFYVYGFTDMTTIGQGQAIVSCVQGFALADIAGAIAQKSHTEPRLFVRRLQSISAHHEQTLYGASFFSEDAHVEIPYEQNSIRLTYGCAQYSDIAALYSCDLTLDGEPAEFGEWTHDNTKEYSYLKPGEYTFVVRMQGGYGQVSQTARLTFRVLPPWYRTRLAYTLWTLLALSIILAIVAIAHKRVKRQKEKMRFQHQQETLQKEKEILHLQNEKIEAELKAKSQELASGLLNNLERNDLIHRVKSSLTKIADDLQDKDTRQALKKISLLQSKLTEESAQNVSWERFAENFDIVNDKFMKKLQARFPWISANEQKLCVYIRMGLRTKEIAPLMNISVRGVEMLRYRLRKKMDLQREDDLENVLKNID